ncbi:MAG: (2Fe-2S)-binding protein [Phycisphaerae bacterium]|nr:(2Fe-2S)-binding protein [Phycisphaerae bacterium]
MRVSFTLNGKAVSLEVDPSARLLDTLRYSLGLTGSKEGCGEGECGACTVYLDGLPVNSCLVPTFQARGRRVETIESIDPASLAAMVESGATQCGACTPGVVMTACWLRRHPELLSSHTARELMAGNLCRCTGYDGIVDGIEASMKKGRC